MLLLVGLFKAVAPHHNGSVLPTPTPPLPQRLLSGLRGRDGIGPLGGRVSEGQTRSFATGAVGGVTHASAAEATGEDGAHQSEKGYSMYEGKTPFPNG